MRSLVQMKFEVIGNVFCELVPHWLKFGINLVLNHFYLFHHQLKTRVMRSDDWWKANELGKLDFFYQ